MKRLIILAVVLLLPARVSAICRTDAFPDIGRMFTSVNWQCVFPVRIAGVRIDPFRNKDNVDRDQIVQTLNNNFQQYAGTAGTPVTSQDHADRKIFCQCQGGGKTPSLIGIRVGFWEPTRVMEVVKDAWCFPFLNFAMRANLTGNLDTGTPESMERFRKNGTDYLGDDAAYHQAFWQVHYYVFPVLAVLDLLTDFICLEQSPMDLAYVTEVDPRWDDEFLSLLLNPEALLFANPVAVMGCIPDTMAATLKSTIDSLYWCMGSWGTVYPLTGYINHSDYVQSAAAAMGRTIFQLHKSFVLFGTAGEHALCRQYPMPIWKKSQYRWHLMVPKRDAKCRVIGEPGIFWDSMKNPPSPKLNMDNFVMMLFRKRDCCAR